MTPLPIALIAAAFSAAVCADPGAIRSTPFLTAQASQQGAAAPQPKAKPAAKPRAPLPAVELTEQVMFKLMIAEVALQRGQPQVAVPAFLELARDTRDPRIAQRATEVAWNARYADAALEAAGIWLQVEPGNQRARQVLAAMLVSQQKLESARGHFEQWLASDRENIGQSFLQLSTLFARNTDRKAVLDLMRVLAKPYQKVPEARLAVAQAAWDAGNESLALEESSAALKLRPDWELAALFYAQALQRRSSDEAVAFLGDYLKTHPQAKDTRLNYARLLVGAKRYPEARKQFEVLVEQFPQNADVTMAVALLAIQANDYDSAETQLKRALDAGYGEPDIARIYLGQLNEERKRFDDALKWYSSVQPGEQYINAQARYAGVLAKQGRLADARKYLQQVSTDDPQQRVQLTQAEAQLLRDANAYTDAFDLLGQALQKMPDTPDLLYDYAMAAEKINRVDVLESNLRKLIQIRPDHAHAYNALGYTLADRSERLPEAQQLIEKALKLSPDDAFIMDSMGWVLFRMGRNREALDYLKRAYTLRPDGDIAAHLGEVLWSDGQQTEARKVWTDALKDNTQNEALQNTIKRLSPVILPAAR
ncbi:MAG TPA: tetratricopeptide repeat protein [Burkholderiales bacterium]|nr:tetratricopeptide repeat protein [Burkholderiales bacterium]